MNELILRYVPGRKRGTEERGNDMPPRRAESLSLLFRTRVVVVLSYLSRATAAVDEDPGSAVEVRPCVTASLRESIL